MVMQVVETLKMDDGDEGRSGLEERQAAASPQKEKGSTSDATASASPTTTTTSDKNALDKKHNHEETKNKEEEGGGGLERLHDFERSDSNLPLSGLGATTALSSFDSSDNATPRGATSSSPSSAISKSVHPKRKEHLLLEARADRLRWIDQVPLPYRHLASVATAAAASDDNERLASFCSSHAAKQLPTALPLIEHLYSMSSSSSPPSPSLIRLGDRIESLTATETTNTSSAAASKAVPTGEQLLMEALQKCKNSLDNNNNDNASGDEDNDASSSSRQLELLTAYHDFWHRLRDPSCAMLVQGMRNFCHSLGNLENDSTTTMATQCRAYLESQLVTVSSHPAWKQPQEQEEEPNPNSRKTSDRTAGEHHNSDTQTAGIRRSLESFIYGQLSPSLERVFWGSTSNKTNSSNRTTKNNKAPKPTMTQTQNQQWMDRLESLQFVTPAHLEIACLEDEQQQEDSENNNTTTATRDLLEAPVQALLSVDQYYSPYEKLQRILQVYRAVNVALSQALNRHDNPGGSNDSDSNKKKKKLPSADDVLPTMILVLLQARPARLLYNLALVEEWSPAEYLRGEAGYAYTNLYGAVHFLQDLDLSIGSNSNSSSDNDDQAAIMKKNHLSMSPEEFRKGLEKCRADMEKKRLAVQAHEQSSAAAAVEKECEVETEFPTIPPHEIRQARLRGETIDLEWARQYNQSRRQQQQQDSSTGEEEPKKKAVMPSVVRSAFDEAAEALPAGFSRNYTFLNSSPEDIRLADLPQLLGEYRMLVQATESLIGDRAAKITAARRAAAAQTKKDLFDRVREVDPSLLPPPPPPPSSSTITKNGGSSPWRNNNNNKPSGS